MRLLPKELKPKFEYDLIRLGTRFDGGYVVEKSSVLNSEYLYSFGISTNWDFEKDFIKLNKIELLAFDGSVDSKFWNKLIKDKIKKLSISKIIKIIIQKRKFYKFFNQKNFISKYVGGSNQKSISFNEIVLNNNKNKIYFKIDIEGGEYEILEDILNFQSNIIGLAIEFHNCNKNLNKLIKFIKNFELDLVHIHANNYEMPKINEIPNVLELTFARSPKIKGEFKRLPHKLDMPNKSKASEIYLNFT